MVDYRPWRARGPRQESARALPCPLRRISTRAPIRSRWILAGPEPGGERRRAIYWPADADL